MAAENSSLDGSQSFGNTSFTFGAGGPGVQTSSPNATSKSGGGVLPKVPESYTSPRNANGKKKMSLKSTDSDSDHSDMDFTFGTAGPEVATKQHSPRGKPSPRNQGGTGGGKSPRSGGVPLSSVPENPYAVKPTIDTGSGVAGGSPDSPSGDPGISGMDLQIGAGGGPSFYGTGMTTPKFAGGGTTPVGAYQTKVELEEDWQIKQAAEQQEYERQRYFQQTQAYMEEQRQREAYLAAQQEGNRHDMNNPYSYGHPSPLAGSYGYGGTLASFSLGEGASPTGQATLNPVTAAYQSVYGTYPPANPQQAAAQAQQAQQQAYQEAVQAHQTVQEYEQYTQALHQQQAQQQAAIVHQRSLDLAMAHSQEFKKTLSKENAGRKKSHAESRAVNNEALDEKGEAEESASPTATNDNIEVKGQKKGGCCVIQ